MQGSKSHCSNDDSSSSKGSFRVSYYNAIKISRSKSRDLNKKDGENSSGKNGGIHLDPKKSERKKSSRKLLASEKNKHSSKS